MVSSEFYREAVNSLRVAASERDAARAEANHLLQKYQDACDDLADRTRERDEAVQSAIAPRAEVERLAKQRDALEKALRHVMGAEGEWKPSSVAAAMDALSFAERDAKGAK